MKAINNLCLEIIANSEVGPYDHDDLLSKAPAFKIFTFSSNAVIPNTTVSASFF